MSELKPCPRCGAEAHVVTEDDEPTMFLCEDCGSWLDVSEFETTENAFKWWNDRPFIDALNARIAELEALVEGHDPFEDFPPKARGFDCSVMVLGKFEYEEEFTPFTNWDLCVYWFDEERWHPLNGYVKGDDIVRWYELPSKERAQ